MEHTEELIQPLPSKTAATPWPLALLERDLVPDTAIRIAIRRLLRQRLREEDNEDPARQQEHLQSLVARLKASPIAIEAAAANTQHYEVPARFYQLCLGRHLKYSSAYWPEGVRNLDQAEQAMLALTAERAQLAAGQRILELGCGWGSLSLYVAEKFPGSVIVSVSRAGTANGAMVTVTIWSGLNDVESAGQSTVILTSHSCAINATKSESLTPRSWVGGNGTANRCSIVRAASNSSRSAGRRRSSGERDAAARRCRRRRF